MFIEIESLITVTDDTLPCFLKYTLPIHEHVLYRVMHMHIRLHDKLTVIKSIEHIVGERFVKFLHSHQKMFKSRGARRKVLFGIVKKRKFDRNAARRTRRETTLKMKYPQMFEIASAG